MAILKSTHIRPSYTESTERYFAFGLHIRSTRPIPGLVDIGKSDQIDLTVWVNRQPTPSEPAQPIFLESTVLGATHENRRLFRFPESGILWIRFDDGTDFYVNRDGTEIWTTWKSPYTAEDMATYLLGPILGYVLRIRGAVALHASSFIAGDKAIALLGGAGAGKSTTVAALALRGNNVLADDVTVLAEDSDGFWALPSYPHLRLWPQSVEMLYGSTDCLKPITPNWDKRDFDLLDIGRFHAEPAHLSTIYVIGDRVEDENAPWIEEMDGQQSFVHLVGNTYGNGLLDESMRTQEFGLLGRLLEHTKIKRVVPHISSSRLDQLCDVILNDCR